VKRVIAVLSLLSIFLCAADLKPVEKRDLQAAILDIVHEDGKLYVATDASKVVILDEKSLEPLQTIKVRQIKDFMGELNDADIYSVDVLDGVVLYLAQAEDGYAELFLFHDGNGTKVLDKSKGVYAKAAKFIDRDHAALALMSDEVILYDLKNQKVVKTVKAGEYFYSAMAIDGERKHIVVGDEGGEVSVIETKPFRVAHIFKDINKDKILAISVAGDLIAAGSRADKTFALYHISTGKAKKVKNPDFFVYVTGISPDQKYAVYGDNEKYILKVVDTEMVEVRHRLVGHSHIVNVVNFLDKDTIITGGETGEIMKWELP